MCHRCGHPGSNRAQTLLSTSRRPTRRTNAMIAALRWCQIPGAGRSTCESPDRRRRPRCVARPRRRGAHRRRDPAATPGCDPDGRTRRDGRSHPGTDRHRVDRHPRSRHRRAHRSDRRRAHRSADRSSGRAPSRYGGGNGRVRHGLRRQRPRRRSRRRCLVGGAVGRGAAIPAPRGGPGVVGVSRRRRCARLRRCRRDLPASRPPLHARLPDPTGQRPDRDRPQRWCPRAAASC